MNKAKTLAKIVVETFKDNTMYLTEDNIMEIVFDNKCTYDDLDSIVNILVEDYKYSKCILNREDASFDNDGHVYTPSENQVCNDVEEWVYVPTTIETGGMPPLDEESINSLLND